MGVYIDALSPCLKNAKWKHTTSCHLFADTIDELQEMADKIGLNRSWLQNDKRLVHYDLVGSFREKAKKMGAIEVSVRFTGEFMQKIKNEMDKTNGQQQTN